MSKTRKSTLPGFTGYYWGKPMVPIGDITCELTGEWADGTKVWSDVRNGDQYSRVKICRKFVFILTAKV